MFGQSTRRVVKNLVLKVGTNVTGVWMWGIRADEFPTFTGPEMSTRTSGHKLMEGLGMSGI